MHLQIVSTQTVQLIRLQWLHSIFYLFDILFWWRFRFCAALPSWAVEKGSQGPVGIPQWANQPVSAVPPAWAVPSAAAAAVGRQRKPQPAAKTNMVSGAVQLAQLGLLEPGVEQACSHLSPPFLTSSSPLGCSAKQMYVCFSHSSLAWSRHARIALH